MLSCEDVGRRLTAYLDAEAAGQERALIREHLAACVSCGGRADAEATARRVLGVRAAHLSAKAPERLRARCAALAARPQRSGWWSWGRAGWARTGLASATVVAIVFAAALGYGIFSHSPTLLAAELRLDHLKCFAFFEPHTAAADPQVVAAHLEQDYGWRVRVPGSLPEERLKLLGARRCVSTDGLVAHVLYRHAGRALSLFVMPRTTTRPETHVELAGRVVSMWTHGDRTFAVLADEGESDLAPIAEYMKKVVEGR
jgi:anti-sigma factor (TIGR02949 family)